MATWCQFFLALQEVFTSLNRFFFESNYLNDDSLFFFFKKNIGSCFLSVSENLQMWNRVKNAKITGSVPGWS